MDRVLEALRLMPSQQGHVREVARRAGVSAPTAMERLQRLEDQGVATSGWVGRSRVYRLLESVPPSLEQASELGRRIAAIEQDNLVSVIVFGSVARGEATASSDLDLLIVLRGADNPLNEAVRLRTALGPLDVQLDLLVSSEEQFNYWSGATNGVLQQVAAEGVTINV